MGILQPNGYRTDGGDDEQKDAEIAHGQRMVEAGAADGRRDQLRVSERRTGDIGKLCCSGRGRETTARGACIN